MYGYGSYGHTVDPTFMSTIIPLLDRGFVYEIAFDGNDAEAEMIEKETGFSFLGESTTPYANERKCVVSGKPTHNRVFLAKTYWFLTVGILKLDFIYSLWPVYIRQ